MASSLSDEEFHRMQLQLIELRTENYQINDKSKRQDVELQSLQKQLDSISRDLDRANKAVSKSKKAKEVELLLLDNDSLQRKLSSQEEEFQLQNSTLMQELSVLVESNERLQKDLEDRLKDRTETHEDGADSEVRRMKAQNAALQQSLSALQESHRKEMCELKQTIHTLQQIEASRERKPPVGGEKDEEYNVQVVEGSDEVASTEVPSLNASMMELVNRAESKTQELEEQLTELTSLRLNLNTEKEENKILKEQLLSYESSSKEQVTSLQTELEKITEKVKKKHESIVQLQSEKEELYTMSSKKIEELEDTIKRHSQNSRDQMSKLQADLVKSTNLLDEQRDKTNRRIQELEGTVSSLQTQLTNASAESSAELLEENDRLKQFCQELSDSCQSQSQATEDLKLQLNESQKAVSTTLQQLCDAQKERDSQIQAAQEASRVAEKRKRMLDELAIRYQEDIDNYKETVKTIKAEAAQSRDSDQQRHLMEYEDITNKLDEAKTKIKELDTLTSEVEPLRASLQSAEEARDWLDRRLKETEESMSEMKTKHKDEMEAIKKQYEEEMNRLQTEHETAVQRLEAEISELKEKDESSQAGIAKLKQEIKDSVDGKKLHEKKGASILKDLKRQLQTEKKKGERLQERLKELITETKGNPDSIEELFNSRDSDDRYKGDNSSVSSLGHHSTSSGYKDTTAESPTSIQHVASEAVLEQENNELLTRLTDLQQDKWVMEEKLSHLETSNAAMAEDLLQKQAIIEHYALEGRPEFVPPAAKEIHKDKLTVKRVIDFVKDKGDENLREVNRKLQRMLEETLTKNVHLQQNLEMLSQEIVRLSEGEESSEAHEADITS